MSASGPLVACQCFVVIFDQDICRDPALELCGSGLRQRDPDLGPGDAGPYQDWRSRNLAAVTQIAKNTQLQARFQQLVSAKRNGKAGMCRDVALELRGKK